ncbi:unnamed protein product [Phytophthora fragariaefolia]|uniref:Unnamed protein product n=1 Tax=Phytophthora fragariaefolia TaxID=1490495 RepID=A0A9W6XVY8_9STRA|nr:unnamed protein product [Phytophthora fragariaefolia]
MNEFGFKLSATKSSVLKKQVKWCGKLIDGELQQFICSTNWMRTSIIDYGRLIQPLQSKFDSVMRHTSRRSKRVASGIPITLSTVERQSFERVKDALSNSAMLAFPNADAKTILVTDSSDVGWSAIVTHVAEWKAKVPTHEQEHELLVCMGGTFTGAQRNWSVIEKEAYPIVTACDKLSYLLMRPKALERPPNFTLTYSPWINGSVERLNKDIIQILRVLCLEYSVDIKDWTYFVPTLQANLNHTPVPSLGNHAPVELFCVLPAASPLSFYLDSSEKRLLDLGEHFPEHIDDKLQKLRESAQLMHKKAITSHAKQTNRNRRNATKPNFDVGDFVLRSRVGQKDNDKLLVTWIDPYQVVQADEHSFRVRHLVTGTKQDVHRSRLKVYADKSFEVTEEIREHIVSQRIILTVAQLIEHRWNSAKRMHEILVSWKGLEPIEDSWESLPELYKDIPAMVNSYATLQEDRGFQKAVEDLS